ncbi:MAG: DNA polymerase IV [Treponema sp.]|uniref:DNA polymerase IV n=1 Tax=Treponema sp. TaxID=166 RepID=UPI001D8F6B10|nr:DNA polymerase IV [Treponema sp.]MBS7241086.1 DNA polymerase IV [Treponema sp.]
MDRQYEKVYLHVDLDAFFASVEQLDHPEYRGKPVIVGGLPGDRRSVVSTASYEARKYGVHSAMPTFKAVKLCPNGIYTRGNYKRYCEISSQIMKIFGDFSPTVIQMSIDEAFIDITGTEHIFGTSLETAKKIKARVKEETGLTVSIGIANTMYIAKIASGYRKPDGITIIPKGKETEFMLSLPLEKVWGAGTKTLERMKSCGFTSTKDIYKTSLQLLITLFGDSTGAFLYNAVRGNKDLIFGEEAKSHSISSETTFAYDLTDLYIIETAIMDLANQVVWRMHSENVRSRTASIKIRYDDFKTVSIQETSDIAITNADDLYERCKRLLEKKYDKNKGIRLLGVCVSNIEKNSEPTQGSLFDFGDAKKAKVERAIFNMENKNPALKLRKARLIDVERKKLGNASTSTEGEQNSRFHRGPND